MSSAATALKDRLFVACRSSAVAAQAGIPESAWSSATVPRVFSGLAGMMGGRNRGRLPFLEVEVRRQSTTPLAQEGGTIAQDVTVRCHVGDVDQGRAADLTAAILGAAAAAIRDQGDDALTYFGDEQIEELQAGPWGLQRDLTLAIEQTYSRDDYGVT